MKAIILLACAVAIGGVAMAQDPPAKSPVMKEGVMKLENRMWYIKMLPDSMPLDNDIMVYSNGTYKTSAGKVFILPDRGRIDFEGVVQDMDQKIDETNGMIVMKNGKVWVWTLLKQPMQVKNGDYVMPDGTLRLTAGNYKKIKDKTLVDLDGDVSYEKW